MARLLEAIAEMDEAIADGEAAEAEEQVNQIWHDGTSAARCGSDVRLQA